MANASKPSASAAPAWLTIVGLGADGEASLTPPARAAVASAAFVAGSARQLDLVRGLIRGQTLSWPSPLCEGIAQIMARRGQPTCVLASGDPFFYGIGATLSRELGPDEFVCFPSPSSLSLAAARLGWPLQDVDIVSLHGRDLHALIRHLQPRRRVLALSWDGSTPQKVCDLLVQRGFSGSRVHVLENLGASSERVRVSRAAHADWSDCADLNIVALELAAEPTAQILPVRGSLDDRAFENDGQLTKQDVRALTLSALAPRAGELLWDVGAGAGSISIEWMLSHAACRAVAIERDAERCARITRNASALGAPGLTVVHGEAPEAFAGLELPDAVFIGGGGSDVAIFDAVWRILPSGARVVMNAVALETEGLLFSLYTWHGGELRRFSIEKAARLGTMTGWQPARPVVQWRVVKP